MYFRIAGPSPRKSGPSAWGMQRRSGRQAAAVLRQAQLSDYPLLSDEDGSVARAYGVSPGLFSFVRPVKRSTFVIGTHGLILM